VGSIGGLLFVGYIFGQLAFPPCAKFYQENQLMSMLYGNAVKPNPTSPPWGKPKSAKVGIFDDDKGLEDLE